MKRVLVIDESPLLRKYLKDKLHRLGLQVTLAINGVDGLSKMYSILPDIIIMDFNLSRLKGSEIVKQKMQSTNIRDIPIIVITSYQIVHQILDLKKYRIEKVIPKPLKIDVLIKTMANILKIPLEVDLSPCILDVHLNENVLFIEIAKGLNKDKIEILKYRILELLNIYKITRPKVLIIMSDLKITDADNEKLEILFDNILHAFGFKQNYVKILTKSQGIKTFLKTHYKYKEIEIAERLEQVMDSIFDLKVSEFIPHGKSILKEDLISGGDKKQAASSELELKFDREQEGIPHFFIEGLEKQLIIAVVDDDEFIQGLIEAIFSESGWTVKKYSNGKEFLQALLENNFDLVFLDILMPEMDGIAVMEHLKKINVDIPVIILSTVTERKMILKAISFGVNSYLIKPLDVGLILKKTQSVFKRDF